jgi:hypothetical protein
MTAPPLFHLHEGQGRLVVSVPHAGTYLPPDIAATLTPIGRAVIDTDWYVDQLYDFVRETDASIIVATHSRTVVDLNRGPNGEKLYPKPLPAHRSIATTRLGKRHAPGVSRRSGSPTTRPSPRPWSAQKPCTATQGCWTHIPSAAAFHACSKAPCRT